MGERGLEQDRVRGALNIGVRRLLRGEYGVAYRAFVHAAALADDDADRELARGLVHLAAAGLKRGRGDERGAERQLAHARRRLAPFLPSARGLDLETLVEGSSCVQ